MEKEFILFLLISLKMSNERSAPMAKIRQKNIIYTPNKHQLCYLCIKDSNPLECRNTSCKNKGFCTYKNKNQIDCCRNLKCPKKKNESSQKFDSSKMLGAIFIFVILIITILKECRLIYAEREVYREMESNPSNYVGTEPTREERDFTQSSNTFSYGGKIMLLPRYEELIKKNHTINPPSYDYYIHNKENFDEDS
ncbi:hypothetical protein HZS_4812 [Henneguya salminicola]|nr:hypothetical protein HZS_4812 [Henneguya salminicola]